MEGAKDAVHADAQVDEDLLPQRLTNLIEVEKSKINNLKYYQRLKDTNYIWHQNTTFYSGFSYAGQVPIMSNPWLPSKAPGKGHSNGSVDDKKEESIVDNVIPYIDDSERNRNNDEKTENVVTESKHK